MFKYCMESEWRERLDFEIKFLQKLCNYSCRKSELLKILYTVVLMTIIVEYLKVGLFKM